MPDVTIAWLCSDAAYNIDGIYNTVQQKFKSNYISARLAQPGAR